MFIDLCCSVFIMLYFIVLYKTNYPMKILEPSMKWYSILGIKITLYK